MTSVTVVNSVTTGQVFWRKDVAMQVLDHVVKVLFS